MIGLAEVDWRRRILLICRAQAEALRLSDERQLGKEVKKNRFIEMLDHELFSTRLLWPRRVSVETEEKGSSRRMTANPLIRFPESVVLCALRDVLADADGKAMGPPRGLQDEAAGPVRWDRTQLAALNKWFEDRGARLGETITAGHVSNYREKKLGQRTVGSLLATVALARNGTREYPRRNGSW
jgi:hypothetical protein